MINDVAVAIRRMQHDGRIRRAMTVDCDVHQGNGTASVFAGMRIPTKPLPSWSAPVLVRSSVEQIPPAGRNDKARENEADTTELEPPDSGDPRVAVRHP